MLRRLGLKIPASRVRQGRKWYEDVGYQLAIDIMRSQAPPDGLFCMSDNLAFGALDALKELGMKVPDDVSVVGFDDRYGAAHVRPPLTTVALPLYEIGQFAGELLLQQIKGTLPPLDAPGGALFALPPYRAGLEPSGKPGCRTSARPQKATARPGTAPTTPRARRPQDDQPVNTSTCCQVQLAPNEKKGRQITNDQS